jgi:hypothetical protein
MIKAETTAGHIDPALKAAGGAKKWDRITVSANISDYYDLASVPENSHGPRPG